MQMDEVEAARSTGQQGHCVGHPPPGIEISLRAAPGSHSAGIVGEILTRGPHTMLGYVGQQTAVLTWDGWLPTGDLGWLDAQHRLWLVGRLKVGVAKCTGYSGPESSLKLR